MKAIPVLKFTYYVVESGDIEILTKRCKEEA
jgi:hypothetical protein